MTDSSRAGPIVGILLAAGNSRRFGSNKLLHLLDDDLPMVLGAVRPLHAACDRVIAVARPGSDQLAALLTAEGCELVTNQEVELGMGHSLACGVESSPDAGGWLVALADMPFIVTSTYRCIVDALRAGSSIAAPYMNGRRGHPVGFAHHWTDRLTTLRGDEGARIILASNPDKVHRCEVNDSGIFRDIDLLSDLIS